MTVDQAINLLATVTLIQMMVTIGLSVKLAELAAVTADRAALLRAALANFVAVPAAVLALLLLFQPAPMVAVGFLIAAVCPGAPYGPPFTALAKGNTVRAIGLMAILAGVSAVAAPLLLLALLPIVAGDEPVRVDVVRLLVTLVVCQFLPLGAGLLIRQKKPMLADRLHRPFRKLTTLLNLALLAVILIAQFKLLAQIRLRGYIGMTCLLAATLLIGWLLGGPGERNRKTLAITTAVRNAGVSLAIAAGSFAGTAAVTTATAYGLFQTVAVALLCVVWGRRSRSEAEEDDSAVRVGEGSLH